MLAGDGQVPAAPHESHQGTHLANENVWAPEAQNLRLAQMVYRAYVCATLQGT